MALGVLLSWCLSLTFLPALLLSLPLPDPGRVPAAGGTAMPRLADWVIRHRRPLLWGSVLVTLGLSVWVPRNQPNDAFVEYFHERVPFRQASDVATERLTGLNLLELELASGTPDGIANPAYLETLDGLAAWLREQPEVMHVAVLTDTLRHVERNLHGDDPLAYRLPDSRAAAAQALLLYEMALPFGRDLTDQVSLDKSATRVTAALRPVPSNTLLALERRLRTWLADRPGVAEVTATGAPPVFAYVGSANIRGILLGNTLTLVAISLLMILALGSARPGLITLLPNLVPTAMAFGVWGLMVGQVGIAIASVTCVTLGIIVNDSIHFLWKYRTRRQDGADPAQAVRHAFATVGPALWVTSLVLVLGFCVLLFSSFVPNADMGLLTAITIAFALTADLLFLPPLLLLVDRHSNRR